MSGNASVVLQRRSPRDASHPVPDRRLRRPHVNHSGESALKFYIHMHLHSSVRLVPAVV